MPIIDFREIPVANTGSGNQDTFELFARDFLVEILKFKILSEPSRGADGGKDILFEECQSGTLSENKFVWLVSCKHKAHSGNSVSPSDEENITDRLNQFNANGFIGFYSTLCSSGLNTRLDSYKDKWKIEVFDKEKIEQYIFNHKRYELLKRYFPESYKTWFELESKNKPTQILSKYSPLNCEVCGKDLLKVEKKDGFNHGIIGFATNPKTHKYESVYAACTGKCDRKMQSYFNSKGYFTAWESLNDLLLPTIYLRRYMALLNQLHEGRIKFETNALTEYKQVLISVSQYVFRHQSEKEIKRVKSLAEIPDGI